MWIVYTISTYSCVYANGRSVGWYDGGSGVVCVCVCSMYIIAVAMTLLT